LRAIANEENTEELFGNSSLAHHEGMNVISGLATETIIFRKALIASSSIEGVSTLINLEFTVSLSKTIASLCWQYKTNL
jgi:hypothetical protein